MKLKWLTLVFPILFWSCEDPKGTVVENENSESKIAINYAQGFSITSHDDYMLMEVNGAWRGENTTYKYILYRNTPPKGFNDVVKVKIPIQSLACMSLTHLSFIEHLGLTEHVVAISGSKYSNNKTLQQSIKDGRAVEVGSEHQINYERLVEQNPSIVMTYGINGASEKYIAKMKKLGLTTVLNAEYMEIHPLGKAEWIKFVAAFFDELDKADRLFSQIENQYAELLKLTDSIRQKPTVFVGMPWQGSWYVAGGKSFQAQLFKDAGADYIWKNNDEKSSMVKSKEVVLTDAYQADFWLNVNSYSSLTEITSYDEVLKNFLAVKEQQVYNYDKRYNSKGGNDYWESGTIEPHIILSDLIAIFHPHLIDHELKYYRKLE